MRNKILNKLENLVLKKNYSKADMIVKRNSSDSIILVYYLDLLFKKKNYKSVISTYLKFCVKMGKIKEASRIIKPAINFLIKKRCKKIILGCTELPIAIFAFKSFKTIKSSKIFLDPNLILANSAMKKYNNR